VQADILWEGQSSLTSFNFQFSPEYNYHLPDRDIEKSTKIWKHEKQEFPQIYNGRLIFIDKMIMQPTIQFNVGIMNYSALVYLARTNQYFNQSRGYLSFKIILYYQKKSSRKYLVGMKSSKSQFDPSNWTMPGGVVEVKEKNTVDLLYSIQKELIEETGIEKVENNITCHLMTKGGRNLGIGMILSLEIDPKQAELIRENEEFEPNSFNWLDNNEILALSDEMILDDVAALKLLIENGHF